jgi:hypothetical protein
LISVKTVRRFQDYPRSQAAMSVKPEVKTHWKTAKPHLAVFDQATALG